MVLRATQEQNQIQEGRRRRKMNDQGLQSIANSLDFHYSIDNRSNLQLCNNNNAAVGRRILGQNNIYLYSIVVVLLFV